MLHQKIFQMIYYANGGFNWNDVYYMPIKLRDFYWRELLKAKETENDQVESARAKSNTTSKARRR
jgi:hypothetical protein